MVWFVIIESQSENDFAFMFQTKLTYGMICYGITGDPPSNCWVCFKLSWLMVWFVIPVGPAQEKLKELFQTKLTYGMICYNTYANTGTGAPEFQTKLTYGMICYTIS